MERRKPPITDDHGGDDDCPICLAAKAEGGSLRVFPGADGSAPEIPEAILIDAARKAMKEQHPGASEAVTFMQFGSLAPDGNGYALSEFTVDGAGRVFWSSPQEHRLVLEVPSADHN